MIKRYPYNEPCSRVLITLIVVLGIAACGGGGGSNGANPPPTTPPPSAPAPGTIGDGRLGELLEWAKSTQSMPVPAMTAVIVQNGQVAEMAAIGTRSIDSNVVVTTDDQWHIGSLTKAVTSTLAGVLVEQSLLRWDMTLVEVWPEISQAIHPDFRNVTLEELLSHTSGMHNSEIVPLDARDNAPGSIVERRRIWVNAILAQPPVTTRGTFHYSNQGYVVAGAMMETIVGTPFETLLQEQLFAPLGMTSTGYGAPGTPGELVQPWGHWDRGSFFEAVSPGPGSDNVEAITPAGRVHSTLLDYSQYMLAHIAGARGVPSIVTEATFNKLHTPVSPDYSLGWVVDPDPDGFPSRLLMHTGGNGMWFAVVYLAPEIDTGAFVAINADGDRAGFTNEAFKQLLVQRVAASQ